MDAILLVEGAVADERHAVKMLPILLLFSAVAFGQGTPDPLAEKQAPAVDVQPAVGASDHPAGKIEILTDTRGVDFGPYIKRIVQTIRQNWLSLIPASVQMQRGKVVIAFAISSAGELTGINLVASSGDAVLDRAAWAGITGSKPFPPLPTEFTGPVLALRLHFYYNPDKNDLANDSTLNGVTQNGVTISIPGKLPVPLGGSEKVIATVSGLKDQSIEWKVTGPGCFGAACGEVKGDLYVAPNVLPDPAVVTLTAISKVNPTMQGSLLIHIVKAGPPQ